MKTAIMELYSEINNLIDTADPIYIAGLELVMTKIHDLNLIGKDVGQILNAFDAAQFGFTDSGKGRGIGGQTLTKKYDSAMEYFNTIYFDNTEIDE